MKPSPQLHYARRARNREPIPQGELSRALPALPPGPPLVDWVALARVTWVVVALVVGGIVCAVQTGVWPGKQQTVRRTHERR